MMVVSSRVLTLWAFSSLIFMKLIQNAHVFSEDKESEQIYIA